MFLSKFLSLSIFIFFAAGIALGYFLGFFYLWLILCLLSGLLAYFSFHKQKILTSDILILVFFLCLGPLWGISQGRTGLERIAGLKQKVSLRITTLPRENSRFRSLRGILRNRKVTVFDYSRSLEYAKTYTVEGKLTKRFFRGISFYALTVSKDAFIQAQKDSFFQRAIRFTVLKALEVFKKNCSQQAYQFLAAVFLGRSELISAEREAFNRAGISHLLAISGLHVGLAALFVFSILRFFNLDFKKSLIFCLIFLWFYAFLSGASIPTRRAALMYTVFAITFLIRRKHNVFNGLALAGLVTLFIAPEALFTISFQLSFCAVSSILIGFRVFKIKTLSNRLANYIKQLFFCSLFVNIGLLPLISFYFGRIYILSIIYNIVFIPFFTLVLGLGFLLIILSFWGFAAGSLGYLLSLLVAGFIQLTHFLGGVRFAFIYYRFSLGQAWLYYPCLFLALSPYIWYKYYKMGE